MCFFRNADVVLYISTALIYIVFCDLPSAFRAFEFEGANSLLPRRGVKSRSRSRSRDRNQRAVRRRNNASPAGRERRSPRCA